MAARWYNDRWLWFILLAATVLALSNLGDRHFWGDEVHLLNLATSITKYGFPVVDDELKRTEVTYEVDDVTGQGYPQELIYGPRIAGKPVYTLHPWLVSAIAAIPIALFGQHHEFLIRLPFVFIGLLAIPITFVLARHITGSRRSACIAALLLAGSTVYLLALRNANYYGLILFAVPALLLCYLRVLEHRRHAGWQFALVGAMLFHSQWLVFMGTMFGLAAHFLIFNRTREAFLSFVAPLVGVFILTFPWFVVTGQFSKAGVISSPMQYVLLLAISAYHLVLWFIPLVFLVFVPWLMVSRHGKRWRISPEYTLLALTIITSVLFASLNYYTGTPVRYYYGLLPLAMIFNAALISKIWNRRALAIVLIVLLVATNWVHVLPLLPFKPVIAAAASSQDVLGTGAAAQLSFVDKTLRPRALFAEYAEEITHHVVSPTRAIIDTINRAERKGTDIFVAAGDANAIGYYTGLRPATYANNFKTREYDWIALPISDVRNAEIDPNRFARRQFPYATDRWGDTADPAHHLFKTTAGEGFYLYRRN